MGDAVFHKVSKRAFLILLTLSFHIELQFMSAEKIRIAIVGYGNIGRYAVQAVQAAKDMELAGIVSRRATEIQPAGLPREQCVDSITKLESVDVAILCGASRSIPEIAPEYLQRGIHTVDSYDIHGEPLWQLRVKLDEVAKQHQAVSVIAAGWDPGSDSVLRTILLAMAPQGLTYTNFGPGMSMGHSVCAKNKPGVADALSMTIPTGTGVHRRLVYVELQPGADLSQVQQAIVSDDYFRHDDTRVIQVASIAELKDVGHGVHIERKGVSGQTHNQLFEFRMSINNPALTSQIMVSCARAAAKRLLPGAYTLPEIPPLDLLPGSREEQIKALV